MPSGYNWWASASEENDPYCGPFETKERAISHALLNGFYEESKDGSSVQLYVCEAVVATIEDIDLDADVILTDLATFYEEWTDEDGDLFRPTVTKEDAKDLGVALNQAFQMWARDHGINIYGSFQETRSGEYITMPTPDHVKNLRSAT